MGIVTLLLVLALLHPVNPYEGVQPVMTIQDDCSEMYNRILDAELGWFFQWEDGNQEAEWWQLCHPLTWPFRTVDDKLHAIGIAQCESGLSPTANDDRWGHLSGSRPQGNYSMMSGSNWPERLGVPWLDPYVPSQAALLAAILVYDEVNPKVAVPNFYWWWSCSHYMHTYYTRLGIYAPEQWYCPARSYWARVPQGSGLAAKKDCGI